MVKRRSDNTTRSEEIDALFSMDRDQAPTSSGAIDDTLNSIFTTATNGRPQFPPLPELQHGFSTLVRDLFAEGLDVVAEYRVIQDALSIKGALTPQAIQEAANNAERMADRAYRLYLVALNEHAAYMREISVIDAALRDAAVAQLEREKANKIRTKQITEADVEATIYQAYPDEWADVKRRKEQVTWMLNYIQNLSDLAKKRCFSVGKMQQG